jgi:hypothetical protein
MTIIRGFGDTKVVPCEIKCFLNQMKVEATKDARFGHFEQLQFIIILVAINKINLPICHPCSLQKKGIAHELVINIGVHGLQQLRL